MGDCVSPSCFHALHRDVAFAIARGRPKMCIQCRFQEVKRRGDELVLWNLQLHQLGVFAHPKAKRAGLGQSAGVVYQALLGRSYALGEDAERYQELPIVTMSYPMLRRRTGLSREETLRRAIKKLADVGLIIRVPKGRRRGRANAYVLPQLDTEFVLELVRRLWGEDALTPDALSLVAGGLDGAEDAERAAA